MMSNTNESINDNQAGADDALCHQCGWQHSLNADCLPPYFGGCPQCGRNDGYLNIGREHWFFCREHKTKWLGGVNLFSGWRDESESRWLENKSTLAAFTEVEPVRANGICGNA